MSGRHLKQRQLKSIQLNMDPGTASNRLVRDVLFSLVVETGKDVCYQCNTKISREDFSIEHKVPWLHSEDPIGLFFGLDNIAFSHLSCNCKAGRKPGKKYESRTEANEAYNVHRRLNRASRSEEERVAENASRRERRSCATK